MSDSIENDDGSLFLDVDDADLHRLNARRIEALDATLPKIIRAAEQAQQKSHDPANWQQVCERLADVRRLCTSLLPEDRHGQG